MSRGRSVFDSLEALAVDTRLLMEERSIEEVRETAERLHALFPSDIPAQIAMHVWFAGCLRALRRARELEEVLERIRAYGSVALPARLRPAIALEQAWSCAYACNYQSALEYASAALREVDNFGTLVERRKARIMQARMFLRLGNPVRALDIIREHLEKTCGSERYELHLLAANAYALLGESEKECRQCEAAAQAAIGSREIEGDYLRARLAAVYAHVDVLKAAGYLVGFKQQEYDLRTAVTAAPACVAVLQHFGEDFRLLVVADIFQDSLHHAAYYAEERGDREGELEAIKGFAEVIEVLQPGSQGGWARYDEQLHTYSVVPDPAACLRSAFYHHVRREHTSALQSILGLQPLLPENLR